MKIPLLNHRETVMQLVSKRNVDIFAAAGDFLTGAAPGR
jgi:hypothetical protein